VRKGFSARGIVRDLVGALGCSCRGSEIVIFYDAIGVYFSNNHVLVMDPNEGEIFANDPLVAALGLQAHLESLFKPGFLGKTKVIEVDFYPFNLRPGQIDRLIAAAKAETVADEIAGAGASNNNAQGIQNNNNAPQPDGARDSSAEGGDSNGE